MVVAIAHRGDPVGHRENTLAAFHSAVELGADMVEIDLRRCRDGRIVVLHDPTLERLWGDARAVRDMDRAEVVAVGGGAGALERIPTFEEVLAQVRVPLMVDFTKREVVEGALSDVSDAGDEALARCLFVTGNIAALRMLRAGSATARIGVTWTEPDPPPFSLLDELGAEFWNPMFSLVTPSLVAAMHGHGVQVSTWTVDSPVDMGRMVDAGVDAIVSNRIGALRSFVDEVSGR